MCVETLHSHSYLPGPPPTSGMSFNRLPHLDVLQPRPTVLQRLRHRLHVQEFDGQRGGLRYAMRRQVPQKLRAVG